MSLPRATDLVARFDFPREQGPGAQAAADTVVALLRRAGHDVRETRTTAAPHRADLATGILLCAALAVGVARRHRYPRALRLAILAATAAATAMATAGGCDRFLPAHAGRQIEIVLASGQEPGREIVLSAHYDSKSQFFDHTERAVAYVVAVLVAGASLAVRRRRAQAAAAAAAAAACALAALATHDGWLPGRRSHGIADDAAACAVLIETAARLRDAPLEHTRVRCLFFGDEEIGAQGSAGWVRVRLPALDALPRVAVNLECIGAGPGVGFAAREWSGGRSYDAPARLVAALHRVSPAELPRIGFPVVTDAGSLRRAGIDAVTLVGLEAEGRAPRGMHGAGDALDGLDPAGIDAARTLLLRFLAACDSAAAGRAF